MNSHLPRVRDAALEHRGLGRLALRMRFEEVLSPADHGIILIRLGDYVLHQRGPVFQPTFHDGHTVSLEPLSPLDNDVAFSDAARHFGYDPPDKVLPFVDQEGRLISVAPLLSQ